MSEQLEQLGPQAIKAVEAIWGWYSPESHAGYAKAIQLAIDSSTADLRREVESLRYDLLHVTAEHELKAENERLRSALERYQFDEVRYAKSEDDKTFGQEISEAHPVNSTNPDSDKNYELALKLVGERHDKYELVDLVNWLLTERTAALKPAQP